MTILSRKQQERTELKNHILEKAKEIFIRDGQEGMTIRKIATEIKYSPGTIYLYYVDKDEILHDLMEKGFEALAKSMSDILTIENAVERLKAMGKRYVKFGLENQDWYTIMFNSVAPMNHIQRCKQEWCTGISFFEFFVATCKEACQSNPLKDKDERSIALQLWSMCHGIVSLMLAQRMDVVTEGDHLAFIDKCFDDVTYIYFNQNP
jgi:AcrR family transcriptional regulator